jgi:GxxExxY protein
VEWPLPESRWGGAPFQGAGMAGIVHSGDTLGASTGNGFFLVERIVGSGQLTSSIIGAAIEVHRELGPGLLESAYQTCLIHELAQRGLRFERAKPMSVNYKGTIIDCAYRIDILVENRVVVELKSVERLEHVHTAQLLTYLKLSGCQIGLLINFNVPLLKDGLRRFVLHLAE